ncbi:MAG: sugar phosphate isomerase/epimerase [Bacillota bacterium]
MLAFGHNCHPEELDEAIPRAASLGYCHLEVRVGETPHGPLWSPHYCDKITALCNQHRVSLSFHACHRINLADTSLWFAKPGHELARATMEAANRAGARWVNFHLGMGYDRDTPGHRKQALECARSALAELVELGGNLGVGVTVENLFRLPRADLYYLGERREDFAYLLGTCPGLGFCYDSGHANLEPSPLGWIESFAPSLVSAHLHDNDGHTDRHLPPGDRRGTADWQAVMAALRAADYRGPFILEGVERTWTEGRAYLLGLLEE